MKKTLFAVLAIAFAMAGCDQEPDKPSPIEQIGCNIGKTVLLGLSSEIAVQLECKNVGAIQDDLVHQLQQLGVCREQPQKTQMKAFGIGQGVCKAVGRTLYTTLTAEKFAQWECTGGDVKERLMENLDKMCGKIQF